MNQEFNIAWINRLVYGSIPLWRRVVLQLQRMANEEPETFMTCHEAALAITLEHYDQIYR